jgi:DNA-3-methyladenine glycosylase II
VRELAGYLLSGKLSLSALESMDDETIRQQLTAIKGIGNWTVDVYLIFILHHADVFPLGDLAAVNALKKLKRLPASASKEEVLGVADQWKPYRTIATMLLWHYYLEERKPGNQDPSFHERKSPGGKFACIPGVLKFSAPDAVPAVY